MFGDDISTDHIAPGRLFHLRTDLPELAKHVLEDARPGFAAEVARGDFVVGGRNFGLGSSREHAPRIIKLAGVGAVLAQRFARIFFRNAINVGLPVLQCDTSGIGEQDELEVDLSAGEVRDVTHRRRDPLRPIAGGDGHDPRRRRPRRARQEARRLRPAGGLGSPGPETPRHSDRRRTMTYTVTLIPGDGTGPELAAALETVVAATGVPIEWEVHDAGLDVMEEYGTPLPEHVLESIRRTKVAIKGPITTPVGTGFRSVNVALRKELDLYACLRPAKSIKGVRSRYDDIDLVIVRENTEDLYAGIEHMVGEDAAESIKIITRKGSERIVRFAFDYARAHGRRKVTAVHKANIMKCTDGLFLRVAGEVAEDYPDIEFEDRIVDNMCMQLVQKPELYDVLVLPNLYGDIVSDLCAGLVGGLGVAPGANIGEPAAVFEPVHGSAPKYAGQDKVNPTALLRCGVLLLEHLGEDEAAGRMEEAIAAVVAEGKDVTYDLGGSAGTSRMAAAIAQRIEG